MTIQAQIDALVVELGKFDEEAAAKKKKLVSKLEMIRGVGESLGDIQDLVKEVNSFNAYANLNILMKPVDTVKEAQDLMSKFVSVKTVLARDGSASFQPYLRWKADKRGTVETVEPERIHVGGVYSEVEMLMFASVGGMVVEVHIPLKGGEIGRYAEKSSNRPGWSYTRQGSTKSVEVEGFDKLVTWMTATRQSMGAYTYYTQTDQSCEEETYPSNGMYDKRKRGKVLSKHYTKDIDMSTFKAEKEALGCFVITNQQITYVLEKEYEPQ